MNPRKKPRLGVRPIKEPPVDESPNITITSVYGSEEETAKAEIELYGSTRIKPRQALAIQR